MPKPLSIIEALEDGNSSIRTGASVCVLRDDKMLLAKRGKEPHRGLWAFPGGSQEVGESLEETARRELTEETGLTAGALEFLEFVEAMPGDYKALAQHRYRIGVFICDDADGDAAAGDDAEELRWCGFDEIVDLPTVPDLDAIVAMLRTRMRH